MARSLRTAALVSWTLTVLVWGWPISAWGEPLQNTNALWIADKDHLIKLSPSGAPVLSIPAPMKLTRLAVDPVSGALWAGHAKGLNKYGFDGSLLFSLTLPRQSRVEEEQDEDDDGDDDDDEEEEHGAILAMDPTHGRPWVGWGRLLLALESDGSERFREQVDEDIEAVAFNSRTREAWVATEEEIFVYGDDGSLLATLHSPEELEGAHLAADPTEGAVWVASHKRLSKYDRARQRVLRLTLKKRTSDLAVDPRTGEVWVTEQESVLKLSPDGRLLLQRQPFHRGHHSIRLAVDPATGNLWVGSKKALALIGPGGAVFPIEGRFYRITDLDYFADLLPPELTIVYPPSEAFVPTNAPTIKLEYSDSASGIEPKSLEVRVDDQDVTSTCQPVEGGSECVLEGTVALTEGRHAVYARVADRMGNAAEASADFTVDTIAPLPPDEALIDVEPTASEDPNQWEVVGGPRSVEAGSTVVVTNPRTGESVSVKARPDGSFAALIRAQQGDVLRITAIDLAGNVSGATEVTVVPLPPQTEASGLIHGLVRDSRTSQPLARVQVTGRGVRGAIFTDASGRFVFPTPGTGRFTLYFERRGYITARRDEYVLSERHATVGEVRLSLYDTRASLITVAQGGVHTDSTGKVQAVFPPGAVAQDIEVSATHFGAETDFPLPTPEGTVFLAGAQMTPEHTPFLRSVTLRIANDLGFAPGTSVPFAFASHDEEDPNEGYYDPGMGTVTPDGAFIEFEVNHFSCVSLGVAPPPSTNPGDQCPTCKEENENDDPCDNNNAGGTSSICISDGSLQLEQRLPSVFALGRRDTLEFNYNSATASPRPLIAVRTKLSSLYFPTPPVLSSWKVSIEGVEREFSFQGSSEETFLHFLWDGVNAGGGRALTGAYHFKATSLGHFNGDLYIPDNFNGLPERPGNVPSPRPLPFRASTGGYLMFNDQSRSPFGAGWGLAELERVYPQPDGTVLWTDGRGASMVFKPGNAVGTKQVFKSGFTQAGAIARDGEGNLHVGEFNGKINRIAPDGSSFVFANVASGLSSLAFDRFGNLYALSYFGSLFKIDPAGRATLLARVGFDLGDMALDPQGNILILDSHHPAIYRVTPEGQVGIFAGYRFGNRLLTYPSGIAMDDAGNLYVSNNYNTPTQKVRCGVSFISRISPQGAHSYYAVGLNAPRGIAFDDRGNLYVADRSCTSDTVDIKLISPTGVVSTVDRGYPAPVTGLSPPYGYSFDLVAGDDRKLYMVADDGTVYQSFLTAPPLGVSVTYSGPAGDHSTLQRHADGTLTRTLKDASRIEFNALGLETARREATGVTTSFFYDGQNRLIRRVDGVGQEWQLSYGSNGLETVTDPAARVTSFTVDGSGDLVQVRYPDQSAMSFGYDGRHLLTRKTDARNFSTAYTYDPLGKVTEVALPTGETRQIDVGRVRTAVNHFRGGRGTPDDPAPPVRAGEFEDRYTDGKNLVIRYISNSFGSVVRVIRPDNVAHEIERDVDNNPVKLIDPNGRLVTQSFDSRGNLLKYDQAGGLLFTLQYHPLFNKPTFLRDGEGGSTSFQYDDRGNLVVARNPRFNSTRYTVDARGLPTRIELPDGGVIQYFYDGLGRITVITDPLQRKTRFEFDAAGNVTKLTDPLDRVTQYFYDAMNRRTGIRDHLGQTTAFTHQATCSGCDDSAEQLLTITDAKTHTTRFEYDAIGQLLRTTDPLDRTRIFTYDFNRNLTSVTDPKGQTIVFEYDVNNRLVKKNLPEGPVSYSYDDVGTLVSLSDANSSLELAYDLGNRLVRVTPGGLLPALPLNYSYDRRNLRKSFEAPWGTLTYAYDLAGNLTTLSGIPGPAPTVNYSYDPLNRRKTASGFISESFNYDLAGQLTSGESRKGAIAALQYAYDLAGNRSNELRSETFFEPDPVILANPEDAVALTPQAFIHGHTPGGTVKINGQPVFVNFDGTFFTQIAVAPGPNSVTIEAVRPNGASGSKTISIRGEPVPVVSGLFSADFAGNVYALDEAGRVVSVAPDAQLSVVSGVDPFPSHVAKAADGTLYAWYGATLKRLDGGSLVPVSELPFVPDDLALLTDSTWLVTQSPTVLRFDSVADTLVHWVTLPISGQRLLVAANSTGEVIAGTELGEVFRILPDGQFTEWTQVLGLGKLDDVSLDDGGNAFFLAAATGEPELCSECPCGECNQCCSGLLRLSPLGDVTTLNATPIQPSIVADAPGNLYLIGASGLERIPAGEVDPQPFLPTPQDVVIQVQIDPPARSRRDFSHDALERLIGATPGESYAYDAVGNRITSHRSGLHVVDTVNQLLEDHTFTYSYDANGNLIEKKSKADGSLTRYTWSSQDHLVRVDLPDGQVAEYTYDPLGRRIQKSVNGVVTKYLYDEEDIIAELDASDSVTATYVHGPGIDEPISLTRDGRSYAYHRDALGSITHITDETGAVVQRYEYDSYGNLLSIRDPGLLQPFTYTGREWDPETGLYHYRARYYDPESGRFLSQDRLGFVGDWNFYSYVRNNPVRYLDPFGLLVGPATRQVVKLAPLALADGPAPVVDIGLGVIGIAAIAWDIYNAIKGERGWGRARGDDWMWELTEEELRAIEEDPDSTPEEKERARRIRKMKSKRKDQQGKKKC